MSDSNPFLLLLRLLSLVYEGFVGVYEFFENTIGQLVAGVSTGNALGDSILDFIGDAIDGINFKGFELGDYSLIGLMFGGALPVLLVLTLVHWIIKFKV